MCVCCTCASNSAATRWRLFGWYIYNNGTFLHGLHKHTEFQAPLHSVHRVNDTCIIYVRLLSKHVTRIKLNFRLVAHCAWSTFICTHTHTYIHISNSQFCHIIPDHYSSIAPLQLAMADAFDNHFDMIRWKWFVCVVFFLWKTHIHTHIVCGLHDTPSGRHRNMSKIKFNTY